MCGHVVPSAADLVTTVQDKWTAFGAVRSGPDTEVPAEEAGCLVWQEERARSGLLGFRAVGAAPG